MSQVDPPRALAEDRYELLELVGVGGMGQVYRALDRRLERIVALKMLRGNDADLRERALREARHQARVDHANVCRVYETGTLDASATGKSFIAMQWLEGDRLDALVSPDSGLDLEQRLEIMRQVSEGVQAAHSEGLIHRDLKPSNVMVSREGDRLHATVVDFGIAIEPGVPGLTATGSMVGTVGYMAPEQIQGRRDELDRRTDVWALGITLYELLTGTTPFCSDSDLVAMVQSLERDPPRLRSHRPELPEELEYVVGKCLEKEPARRYASARLLAEDLERFLLGEPVLAQKPSRLYRTRRWISRHRGLALAVALASLVVLVAGAEALRLRWQARQETQMAQELGREAERIAGSLRVAQLAPLHDLAKEKAELRRHVAELEATVASRGVTAEGPGLVAAGEAFLALGDLEAALDRLERAWDGGYRGIGLSRALGRSRGRLYLRRAIAVRHLGAEVRQAQLEQERRHLLEPALDQLTRVERPVASDRVFAALLRGETANAESMAEEALEASPYDLDLLRWLAEAQAQQAAADHLAERTESALAHLEAARRTYRRAQAIGRSHPLIYGGECELAQLRLEIELIGSDGSTESPALLLEPCDLAVATDSSSPRPRAQRAALERTLAARAMRRGDDPLSHLRAAIADGETALELDPNDLQALYHTGVAFSLRASDQQGTDEEIGADLERAGELLRRCAVAAPDFVPCLLSLGVNRLETGIHLDNLGRPSRRAFEAAILTFKEAIELAPGLPVLHNDLGYTQGYFAGVLTDLPSDRFEPRHVDEVRRLLEAGEAAIRRATQIAPDYASAWLSLAELHKARARYLVARGQPADQTVAAAVAAAAASYARVRGLDASRFYAFVLPIDLHLMHAEALLDQGLDGLEAAEGAAEALARAEAAFEDDSACDHVAVEATTARALRAVGEVEAAALAFERAEAAAKRDDCLEPLAALRTFAALGSSRDAWPRSSTAAQAAIDAAVKADPGSLTAHVLAARLLADASRRSGDERDAEQARAAWRKVAARQPMGEPRWRRAQERAAAPAARP